jgi:hypothetical protein
VIILKSKALISGEDIAKFVNINHIKREDILTITTPSNPIDKQFIYYYADPETEEITRGFFGWPD